MLRAHWHAYQWSTSGYWKLPALSVVAGVMSRGSGWLRLEPWSLGLPNGRLRGSLHRMTLVSVAGVGVVLVGPAGAGAGGMGPGRSMIWLMRVNGIWVPWSMPKLSSRTCNI